MAALPQVPVGRARLVEREASSDFLRHLNDSESSAQTFARKRAEGGRSCDGSSESSRFRITPAIVDSPPRMMSIERGELRVTFQQLEELAGAMLYSATIFNHDLDGYARLYEPTPDPKGENLATFEAKAEARFFHGIWERFSVSRSGAPSSWLPSSAERSICGFYLCVRL